MTPIYRTITGRRFGLDKLSVAERRFLRELAALCGKKKLHWTPFAARWSRLFDELGLRETSPVYRIAQDLEARIGIAEGKVAPPDYRDCLADLIEERFGSRYRFCKKTGFDAGQLSRVLSGRADLSVPALGKILNTLRAVMVLEPADVRERNVSPKLAAAALLAT